MDGRRVQLDKASIDDIVDATMKAVNAMDGDDPSGWAWHPWSEGGSLQPLRGLWALWGPGRHWWADAERADEAGLAHFSVTLEVALEMAEAETEGDAEAKADGYTHKYRRGGAIEIQRLGVPAGALVQLCCEHPLAEPVLADLWQRLAEYWRPLAEEAATPPTVPEPASKPGPDVPTSPAVRGRWKAYYKRVKGWHHQGMKPADIAREAKKRGLKDYKEDRVRDIIRAGEAGLLDD